MAINYAQAGVEAKKLRLPRNVLPMQYDLALEVDLESFTFSGTVEIQLEVVEDTNTITFNASGLHLSDPHVCTSTLGEVATHSLSLTLDPESQQGSIHCLTTLAAGTTATVRLTFNANLSRDTTGYFCYSWDNGDGRAESYAATLFQPAAARRAFPCWDEPDLKAVFTISLLSRSHLVNLSNMPIEHEYVAGPADAQWKLTKFQQSPKMSTYLVAFATGNFAHAESSYVSPLTGTVRPLRVYAHPDDVERTHHILDVTRRIMPVYEAIFDVEFPLPKLDSLVLRNSGPVGMENWGLILSSDDFVRSDASAEMKRAAANFQAHEIGHMWFGDIVTMKWWDTLYLNEGFATLMGEMIAVDRIFPEFRSESHFVNSHYANALRLDGKLSSHPIEVSVPDVGLATQIFDAISYSKAASVLRMLAAYVGEENFLQGVSLYLKKHIFGNSVSSDLWDAIGQVADVNVVEMMRPWIYQVGFPVLKVTEETGHIRLTQRRFLETPSENENFDAHWTVPVTITASSSGGHLVHKRFLLTKEYADISLEAVGVFKLNDDSKGLYYVAYTPEQLQRLTSEAGKADSFLSSNDRMGLLRETLALARADYYASSNYLDLVDALKENDDSLVWISLVDTYAQLGPLIDANEHTSSLSDTYLRSIVKPIIERLGFDYPQEESLNDTLLRTLALRTAAFAGEEKTINWMRTLFYDFVDGGDETNLPSEILSDIFLSVVKYGDSQEYWEMSKVYEETTGKFKTNALSALCATKDTKLLQETLNIALGGDRDVDWFVLFKGMSTQREGRVPLARFFMENFDEIAERFQNGFRLPFLVQFAFSNLTSKTLLQEVELFFKDKDTAAFEQPLSQALDNVRTNVIWAERSTDEVLRWLEEWQNSQSLA